MTDRLDGVATFVQVVEERGQGAVRGRQQIVLQVCKDEAVIVPALVVAEIHLDQVYPKVD